MMTRLLHRLARAGAAWRRENSDRDQGFTLVEILDRKSVV